MSPALLVAAGTAFAVAATLIVLLLRSPLAARLVDRPNERSLHQRPTPRIGGLGLMAGVAAAVLAQGTVPTVALVAVSVALAAVSASDDASPLPVVTRLAAHLCAAALAVAIVGPDAHAAGGPLAAAFLAALAITWMANLYNFMDGADGLAGGMTVIGFFALALAAEASGGLDVAVVCVAIGAAGLAFLAFNFPPARIFLGDAGSVPLGFLAGALGWLGTTRGLWAGWFPALVFSPFIADATVTLTRRMLRAESVWKAHRSHYYQRLVLGGWSHRRLALWQWGLMALVAASALAAREATATMQGTIIALWVLAYAAIAVAIDRRHPREPAA